jgi:hypothetical protein
MLLSVSSTGCFTWDVQQRAHKVKIVTDPPGATIWQHDGTGNRKVGTGPTEVTKNYEVKVSRTTPACWIVAGAMTAGAAASGYWVSWAWQKEDQGDGMPRTYKGGSGGAVLSLTTLMVAGIGALAAVPACISSQSASGKEIVEPGEVVKLAASMPGYKDEEVTLSMPGPQTKIHLSLRPRDGAAPASNIALASAPAGGQKAEATGPAFVSGAPQPASYALVVGIERYRDVPSPTGARADSQTFRRLARQTLGIPEANVREAIDDRATRGDIEKHIEWLAANVQPGGRIYFYFSGHGAPDASVGTPYLLPYDGDPKFLARTALPLASVLKSLGETKARDVLAIVDTCFSGAGGRSVLPEGARPLVRVKEAPVAPRLALLTASSGAEISGPSPSGSGGLFTHYLAEGLGRGQADINGDGQISLQELGEWVRPRVAREARKDNRDQTPSVVVGSGLTGAGAFIVAQGVGH